MRLLFDENVSPKLVASLAVDYPGSLACQGHRLARRSRSGDLGLCADSRFAIVSKDTDFRERSYVSGFPPKIIWLDVGNLGTVGIIAILTAERARVERFAAMEEASVLILSSGDHAV